ncbi:hypothetical protein CTZ27_13435 [Streptomyces griseocarneus]|nr:hypothetical protein CTZ27_13435 [Streptomyces griseocarneus]
MAVVAGSVLVALIVGAPGAEGTGRPGPGPHRPHIRPAPGLLRAPRATPTPVPSESDGRLAGSTAGEGRTHPGRATESADGGADDAEDADTDQDDPDDTPSPSVRLSIPPSPWRQADAARPGRTPPPPAPPPDGSRESMGYGDHVMRVLPLGTGMTLTGLGLGFFALRLRRSR